MSILSNVRKNDQRDRVRVCVSLGAVIHFPPENGQLSCMHGGIGEKLNTPAVYLDNKLKLN
jgi:hypothetical protein